MKKLIFVLILAVIVCGVAAAEEMSSTVDPMYLGVGARPLGMGKSFVAVAEGADALLLNPAGIAKLSGIKMTSMFSNMMDEANYMVLAGAMPVSDSMGLGAGIVAISVSDILLSDGLGNSLGTASYMNGVGFISMGIDLEKDKLIAPMLPNKGKDLSFGANLKMFFQNASGADVVSDANGSGINMDLGLLYAPKNKFFSLGANIQNALPASLGGKVSYQSGAEDELPMLIKLGSKFTVLGQKASIRKSDQKLDVLADIDFSKWGTGLHLGLEYLPAEWVSIRAGVDQDASPLKTPMNPTFGVGLNYSGFSFDYAYHPYGETAENATHFFSISVALDEIGKAPKAEVKVKEEPKEEVKQNRTEEPKDDTMYTLPEEYKNLGF